MENRAAFAPIPSARVTTAAVVKPGARRSERAAYFRSCVRLSITVS
jgi:hypothetical protein